MYEQHQKKTPKMCFDTIECLNYIMLLIPHCMTQITQTGKLTKNDGKSPFLVDKSTNSPWPFSTANCKRLPEGTHLVVEPPPLKKMTEVSWDDWENMGVSIVMGVAPVIIHFERWDFSRSQKPSIFGCPHLWTPPNKHVPNHRPV